MDTSKLQEFVTITVLRNRITFGDVRRLQRDYLPNGVTTCEEAEMLIRLDGVVARTDKAWTAWLVASIVDFAVFSERPADAAGSAMLDRLKTVLAAIGTKAARKIGRQIHHIAEPIEVTIPFPVKRQAAPAALSGAGLELAA